MKIGFVQFAPVLGNVQANIGQIERLVASVDANLLVLPELCNSGYNFQSREEARAHSEVLGHGVYVKFLTALCQQRSFHIVSGMNERDGDRLYNSAVLVGPQGYVGRYRKMHLFMNEKDIFEPGDAGLPVFDLGTCRVGMLICFDWQFPEVWRILALKGADVICHPSNLVLPTLAQRAVPVMALLNHVYAITGNRIGVERGLAFTGCSLIAGPKGDVLAQAAPDQEAVMVVDVDPALARDKRVTARNDQLDDRRPSEYRLLVEGS